MSRRLYAQYQPGPDSLKYLVALQRQVALHDPRARSVPHDQIHLTIIHFGIIDDIFPQLQALAPHLYYTTYRQAVADFVREVSRAMPPRLDAQLQTWEMLGANERTLAVGIEPNMVLQQAHQASLQALLRCFAACGLSHPERFITADHNFQYALTLKPHITLLKNAAQLPSAMLEPKILHLEAMPILYD